MKPLSKRLVKQVKSAVPTKMPMVVIVTAAILPLYILGLSGGMKFLPLALLVLISMIMVSAFLGPNLTLLISPAVALAFAGSALLYKNPLAGAALVALIAFLARLAMVSSKGSMVIMIPIVTAMFVAGPPLLTGHDPAAWANVGAIFYCSLAASFWAAFVSWLLLRRIAIPQLAHLPSLKVAVLSGFLSAAVVGVATWVVLDHHLGKGGGWLILTLLIIFQPFTPGTMVKAIQRAVGTLLGFLFVALLLLVEPNSAPPWAFALPGILALVAAFGEKLNPLKSYWEYVTFLTIGIVLVEGSGSGRAHLAKSIRHLSALRLHYTIIGVIIGLIATAIVLQAQGQLFPRSDVQESVATNS